MFIDPAQRRVDVPQKKASLPVWRNFAHAGCPRVEPSRSKEVRQGLHFLGRERLSLGISPNENARSVEIEHWRFGEGKNVLATKRVPPARSDVEDAVRDVTVAAVAWLAFLLTAGEDDVNWLAGLELEWSELQAWAQIPSAVAAIHQRLGRRLAGCTRRRL